MKWLTLSAESLSTSAYESLSEKDRLTLSGIEDSSNSSFDLPDVLKVATDKAEESRRTKLKIRLPNGTIFIFRDVYANIMRWTNRFIEVGDAAVQYDPGHAALPWAGVRFLLKVTISDLERRAVVLEGLESVVRTLTWVRIHEKIYLQEDTDSTFALSKCLIELYSNILRFLAKVKRYQGKNKLSRVTSSVFSSTGKFRKHLDAISSIQKEVETYASQISRQTQVNQNEKFKDLLGTLQSLDRPLERIQNTNEAIFEAFTAREQIEVLDWVSTMPFQKHHAETSRKALADTGGWLFNHERYRNWHNSSRSEILWIHGMAGSGKSVLLSLTTQSLILAHEEKSTPLPLYCYCARSSQESSRSNPEEILRSLLRQASEAPGRGQVPSELARRHEKRRVAGDLSMDESVDMLMSIVECQPVTYILIDALDECDRELRYELVASLERILQESSSLVKLFVTSRDDQDIVLSMETYPEIRISADENQSDIDLYVSREVDRMISARLILPTEKVSEDLRNLIKQRLRDGAQGMFRWVELQLQYIAKIRLPSVLKKRLGTLPKQLRDIYGQLYTQNMSEMDPDEQRTIKCFLSWLLVSQRPLRSPEVICLINRFQEEESVGDVRTLLALCFNLVEYDIQLDTFRFVHLSVREFLEDCDDFGLQACHKMAATNAVELICALDTCPAEIKDYVRWFWPYHTQQATGQADDGELTSLLRFFLVDNTDVFAVWSMDLRVCYQSSSHSGLDLKQRLLKHSLSAVPHPLLCAVQWDFGELVSELLDHADTGELEGLKDLDGAGVVSIAAAYGRTEILSLLLEKGLSPSQPGGKMGLPLLAASSGGFTDVIDMLLKAGADINATYDPLTALQAATHRGDETTVSFLLERGADATLSHPQQKSPLQIAAYHGYHSIVGLLLARGAACDIGRRTSPSELIDVVEIDEQESIQLTLSGDELEADSPRNHPLIDALQTAVKRGHIQFVVALLNESSILGDKKTIDDLRQVFMEEIRPNAPSTLLPVAPKDHMSQTSKTSQTRKGLPLPISRVNLSEIIYGIYEFVIVDNRGVNDCRHVIFSNKENPGLPAVHEISQSSNGNILTFMHRYSELLTIDEYSRLLHVAIRARRVPFIQALLDLGADVDSVVDGQSCLLLAVDQYDSEVADVLLERGASLNLKVSGMLPVERAGIHCSISPEMIGVMLKRNDISKQMTRAAFVKQIVGRTGLANLPDKIQNLLKESGYLDAKAKYLMADYSAFFPPHEFG